MNFRKDINGLRAIAVIAVVLFHFNENWMPGGFAGVDVFFVISGFLMTGIIFKKIEQDNFSILNFYVARANRIIPALAALCFVLLLLGWFFLNPVDYKALGKHAGSSVMFVSNIIYWKDSGYFDAASQEKWLLHTWSLSVEWQFYILYPLVLVAMRKLMSLRFMKATILIGTIIGFVFSVLITYKSPSAAFYLLPTRAWEMMIGGVAYLYPINANEKTKKIMEWAGIALIVLSYFLLSEHNLWPGYLSFVPVIGAFLLIQANRSNSIVTDHIIFQRLGKWSYSIYLWHWPLVVAMYFYNLSQQFIFYGIALSVLLGFLSNKYIESINFKTRFSSSIDYLKCKPVYFSTTLFVLSGVIYLSNGMLGRFEGQAAEKYQNAMQAIGDWEYPKPNLIVHNTEVRFIKGNSDKNILFIGASHIEQTFPYAEKIRSPFNIYYVTDGGCFIAPSFEHPLSDCANIQNYEKIITGVNFDKIITSIYTLDRDLSDNSVTKNQQIVQRVKEYNEFLKFAKENAKEVYMILGEPKGSEFDPKLSVRNNLNTFITRQQARKYYSLHYEALEQLDEKDGVYIIDPIDYLCDDVCMTMDDNYKFYYKDATHMRPWYAKEKLAYLESIFNK
ncbi:MAG: acyltransferase [Alteromonadaceae bacterium]|nr:acyltransferase [Alteromonadaceae bacterium]